MIDRAVVLRIRRLAAKGLGTVVIGREVGVAPKTVRRYLTSPAADVQVRPSTRRLTDNDVAAIIKVYREEAGHDATQTSAIVRRRGVQASTRTIQRAIATELGGRRPKRRPTAPSRFEPDSFAFSWAGKETAAKLALKESSVHLVREGRRPTSGKTPVHELIVGDNIDAMKLLRDERGAFVKLAYLDPPYGTGTKFTYSDALTPGRARAPRDVANASWLSMLYPRLLVLRDLLLPNGVVAVSIDDRHVHHVRMLLDEVLGEAQFLGCVTVRSNPRGKSLRRHVATNHEFVVLYARDRTQPNIMGGTRLRVEDVAKYYKHQDERGRFAMYDLRGSDHRRRREDQQSMFFPLYVDAKTGAVSAERGKRFSVAVYPEAADGHSDGVWTWGRARAARESSLLTARKTPSGVWRISRKVYADGDAAFSRTTSIWAETSFAYRAGKKAVDAAVGDGVFQFAKSVALLRRIAEVTTSPRRGDTILDVFAGSGTFAEAVVNLNVTDGGNRRVICMQTPEPTPEGSAAREAGYETIADICQSRVRNAIKSAGAKVGFNSYRLAK